MTSSWRRKRDPSCQSGGVSCETRTADECWNDVQHRWRRDFTVPFTTPPSTVSQTSDGTCGMDVRRAMPLRFRIAWLETVRSTVLSLSFSVEPVRKRRLSLQSCMGRACTASGAFQKTSFRLHQCLVAQKRIQPPGGLSEILLTERDTFVAVLSLNPSSLESHLSASPFKRTAAFGLRDAARLLS